MIRITTLFAVISLAACGGAKAPIPLGGDASGPDDLVVADSLTGDIPLAELLPGEDTIAPPDDIILPPEDNITPPDDTISPPPDLIPDLPPDVTIPPGCCLTDNDCNDPETAAIFVCAGKGLGEPEWAGVCVPPATEAGRCWANSECDNGQLCIGASLCGCGMDCDMDMWNGPGICIDPDATCQTIQPSWVEEICNAASVVVWDGEACVATCPGCCGCQGWCDYTFQSMDECHAACLEKPPPECPTYITALADSHHGLYTGDDGCPTISAMNIRCESDETCAGLADAGLPGFGQTCVLGNCVQCWNNAQCGYTEICRGGRCVPPGPGPCPDAGACSAPGCHLINPSEAPCAVCSCDTVYNITCSQDANCLPFSFHPFSRCVYGRCADCRSDADCDWGRCIQPGICYEMTPPADLLFGTWLIGWSGGMNHFSYFRFETDGTLRRAAYETTDPMSSFMDDVPPFWDTCDPGWPVPAPLIGTWEPEVTQSGFLVIRVRLGLTCADDGWNARWMVSPTQSGPWTTLFDDIYEGMDLYGWKVDGGLCADDFSYCPQVVDPWL